MPIPSARRWQVARAQGLVFAAVLVALFLLWYCHFVVLLSFAAILFGVVLNRTAAWVQRRLHVSHGWSLTLVLVGLASAAVAAGLLLAPEISAQISMLSDSLPKAFRGLQATVESLPWARRVWHSLLNPAQSGKTAILAVPAVLAHTSELLGAALYVFFGGIFLAGTPDVYLDNVLRLFPLSSRGRWREAAVGAADNLTAWVRAQLILMGVVGSLTVIGLWAIKVPMALTLGVLTAMLLFVPYTGAVVSSMPAILVALMTSVKLAIATAGVFVVAHVVEAYLVGPLVQRKLLSMPPALVLAAELLFGFVWGVLGVALATPIVATVIPIIQRVYLPARDGEQGELTLASGGGNQAAAPRISSRG